MQKNYVNCVRCSHDACNRADETAAGTQFPVGSSNHIAVRDGGKL